MAEADQLMQAIGMVGGTFTGIIAVIVAWGKAREMANKPLDDMKIALMQQISAGQAASQAAHQANEQKLNELRRNVDAINVHFDPNGANIRGKLSSIETRLASLEVSGSNERAELKGLINDLTPIVRDLARERS